MTETVKRKIETEKGSDINIKTKGNKKKLKKRKH